MNTLIEDALFDREGNLLRERLDEGAYQVLNGLAQNLAAMDRRMFLPLDLLIALLERGHQDLARLIAFGTDGAVSAADVASRLEVLAREIEEERSGEEPKLRRSNFSRGFIRILEEGWAQARHRGQAQIMEADLARSLRWRAEAVESASIRWSIRRLSEGGGDELFDERSLLRMELFDPPCQAILRGAMTMAASNGTSFLGTPHLVAMMASIRDSVLWRSAQGRGLKPDRLREELLRLIGPKPDPIPEFLIGRKTLTPRVIRIFQRAIVAKGAPLSEVDLVETFLVDGGSSLELVQALGLESEIRQALGEPRVLAGADPVEAAIEFAARRPDSPTLDMLGRDLTQEALEGRLPQIVGREKELQLVFNVLMRREQRNPLLTGEAGVGKTALAAALAQQIASGQGPDRLRGYRVIEINGASLMGGTTYRGDLEARIESLIEEASQRVILFIDEAHAVFAPRSGSNTPAEVPNHFKSALASGTIAVMGATTADEYHRWIEQDPALKRRFERIEIEEPTAAHVRHILSALAPEFEAEYGVQVLEEAIDSAIELSTRFLPEQRLPDKAKKLLMDACIAQINPLAKVVWQESEEQAPSTGDDLQLPLVDRNAVARQLHLKTSIPLERLLRGEIPWWVGLEERLKESVVGQEEAMGRVAKMLVASRLTNADCRRPLSALAFVGPQGVGKARAARALAREIFYDERALISLDMSDFQEAHALSRLIGSPPGYVGYEDADMLVTPLRRRPSSVVLLEDFDRAHPRIQDRMLRFIEEGELVDTRGHRADATNAIFILTISIDAHSRGGPIGFGKKNAEQVGELEGLGLVERLRSRVDGVILFRDLSEGPDEATQRLLESLIARFVENSSREYDVEVQLTDDLRAQLKSLAAKSARSAQVERLVERLLVAPVAAALLDGRGRGATLILDWDELAESTAVREDLSS